MLFGRGGNLSVGSHPSYNLWGRALSTCEQTQRVRCGTVVEEVVLLVVRVDYANLAFALQDLHMAWVSATVHGLRERPRVIFMNAHSKIVLDELAIHIPVL